MASFQGRPCRSLHQPIHRRHPDIQQDPIRWRHLVTALETSLRQQHATDAVESLLEPFKALAHDHDPWNHALGGLDAQVGATVEQALGRFSEPVNRVEIRLGDGYGGKRGQPDLRRMREARRLPLPGTKPAQR